MKASGVILSGGRSSRMKFNKAFARISSDSAIEIIINKFKSLFNEVLIISNDPDLYSSLGVKVCTDVYPRLGPVSGIHSALYHSANDAVFLLGCDMPFINMRVVEFMLQKLNGYDSVVPEINSWLQPTAAAYHRKCLPVFTDCLENNKLKLTLIFKELNALVLKEKELECFGKTKEMFFNVNDPDALETARKMAGRLL